MVVSVVINCTYFEEIDSFTSGSKDKAWGRLEMRAEGQRTGKTSWWEMELQGSCLLSTDQF